MSVFTPSPPHPAHTPPPNTHIMIKSHETYSLGFVEMCHLNVAPVMVGEIEEVEGEADPEVRARHPHEDGGLKALGEVRVAGVPRDIPLLQTQTQAQVNRTPPRERTRGLRRVQNYLLWGLRTMMPSQAEQANWKDQQPERLQTKNDKWRLCLTLPQR